MVVAGLSDSLIRLIHGDFERVHSSRYFLDNRTRGGVELFVLQLTLKGRAFFEKSGEVSEVPIGHVMLFQHGEDSSYGYYPEDEGVYELEWIGFSGELAGALVALVRERFGSVFRMPESSDAYSEFKRAVRMARLGEGNRFLRSALLYSLLLALFRLPEQQGIESKPEERAFEIMQNEFSGRSNVKEIAARLGCSREHLTRCFRQRYGISPAKALREIRLERARELLEATHLSVADIAARCGMPDHNAFHVAFRCRYGMSPGSSRTRRRSV